MPDLVPIKILIKRKFDGRSLVNDYPNFNLLPPEVRGNMDWSHYLDQFIGWHYDKVSGFGESDTFNPDPDTQLGCTCVPEAFALAAVTTFPDRVSIINESEFETFYDNRAHAHEPPEHIDKDHLAAINERKRSEDLGLLPANAAANAHRNKALDPDDPTPGIRRNHNKTWALFKKKRNVKILAKHAKGNNG
jgi:hypothetical protein